MSEQASTAILDSTARLDKAVAALRSRMGDFVPQVGMVLGSGLGAFGDTFDDLVKIPYEAIDFPSSGVAGHAGKLCLGRVRGVRVACLQGRVHGYEGHSQERIVFGVRALARWGASQFLLTNAAGGVNAALEPGDLMLLSDHLNLTGNNPLIGRNDDTLGARFPDMTQAYDPAMREICRQAAKTCGVALREGVYAALSGPSYETPAEIRMLRVLGADAVGMSTVPEVIALRHMGRSVIAISCITNKGAGLSSGLLHHGEVQEVADRTRASFVKLLNELVSGLSLSKGSG